MSNCIFITSMLGFLMSSTCGAGLKNVHIVPIATYGQSGEATFTQVGQIACDEKGSVYVSDAFQYSIKKFDNESSPVRSSGRRGKADADFQSGPYLVDYMDGKLSVVESATGRIHIYSQSLNQTAFFQALTPVVDMAIAKGGKFYVSEVTSPRHYDETILYYDSTGALLSKVPLRLPSKDPIYDMCVLAVDKNDNLIVATKFKNIISIYDPAHNLLAEASIPGLPAIAITDSANGTLSAMPEELITDVATHPEGYYFILGGFYSPHPDRDVYVLDAHGNLLVIFTLPESTGTIYVDRGGFLFTRENKRSIVRKYRVDFEYAEGAKK